MSKILIALGVVAAFAVPATAQPLSSPRISSQIVSPDYAGNTPATAALGTAEYGFGGAVQSAPVAGERTGVAADLFGANGR